MQRLDLIELAKRKGLKSTSLAPVGPSVAVEVSLRLAMNRSISLADRMIRENKDLFLGIKGQLKSDAASVAEKPRKRVVPSRDEHGRPWWMALGSLGRRRALVEGVSASSAKRPISDTAFGFALFMEQLRSALDSESSRASGSVAAAFADEERRNRTRLGNSIKSRFGIDAASLMTSGDVRDTVQVAVQRSVGLIRGLNDDVAKRVEFAVLDAAQRGQSTTVLSERLRGEMGVARNRARLIAKDQVSSLNSALNRVRQEQFGIDSYVWRTVGDERVRDEHASRDGKVFRWDDPPEDGNPGEPIGCRCVAQPWVG